MVRKKRKCDCGNVAEWFYMPGYGNGANSYVCDDCVTSIDDEGCSCNYHYTNIDDANNLSAGDVHYSHPDLPEGIEGKDWRWVDKDRGCWINLDEKGRPYPCAEYDYEKGGHEIPTFWDTLEFKLWWFRHSVSSKVRYWWRRHIVDEAPKDINL